MKKILALIITLFISVSILSAGSMERLERKIRNTEYFPSSLVKFKSNHGSEIILDINNPNLIIYTSGVFAQNTYITCNNLYIEFINMDIDYLIKLLDDLSSNRIERIDEIDIRIIRS